MDWENSDSNESDRRPQNPASTKTGKHLINTWERSNQTSEQGLWRSCVNEWVQIRWNIEEGIQIEAHSAAALWS